MPVLSPGLASSKQWFPISGLGFPGWTYIPCCRPLILEEGRVCGGGLLPRSLAAIPRKVLSQAPRLRLLSLLLPLLFALLDLSAASHAWNAFFQSAWSEKHSTFQIPIKCHLLCEAPLDHTPFLRGLNWKHLLPPLLVHIDTLEHTASAFIFPFFKMTQVAEASPDKVGYLCPE